jgi:hypothetical protein
MSRLSHLFHCNPAFTSRLELAIGLLCLTIFLTATNAVAQTQDQDPKRGPTLVLPLPQAKSNRSTSQMAIY